MATYLITLAFFEKDDTGLDAVRSKTRAVNLLLFLADYVLETDGTCLDTVEGECECGQKHRYYRAAWLVPMWEKQWVPLGDNKRSAVTAEAIAQLFEGRDDELRRLTTGNGRSLLKALKIGLADLALQAVANDDETRFALMGSLTDIVQAMGNDAERVRLIADEIKESPDLLTEINKRRQRRERVLQNQSVGAEVERLLKEALEGSSLRVNRTGVGSDYEVEQDHVVGEEEVLLAVEDDAQSFLIEIKATYGDAVRMTTTQAKTAVENKGRFALCIVRLDGPVTPEAVRNGCRFVMDIGDRIEPVWGEYTKYQSAKVKACARVGDVELVMDDAQIRFSVSTEACDSGLTFDEAVARLSVMPKPHGHVLQSST